MIGRHWNIKAFQTQRKDNNNHFFPSKNDQGGDWSLGTEIKLFKSNIPHLLALTHYFQSRIIISGYKFWEILLQNESFFYHQLNNCFIKRPIKLDYSDPGGHWGSHTRICALICRRYMCLQKNLSGTQANTHGELYFCQILMEILFKLLTLTLWSKTMSRL